MIRYVIRFGSCWVFVLSLVTINLYKNISILLCYVYQVVLLAIKSLINCYSELRVIVISNLIEVLKFSLLLLIEACKIIRNPIN